MLRRGRIVRLGTSGWSRCAAAASYLAASVVCVALGASGARAESLSQIYELALSNDPGLQAAEIGTLIGEREFRDALFGYFPRVEARFDVNHKYQDILSSDNKVFAIGRANYGVKEGVVEAHQPLIDYGLIMRIRKGAALKARSFAEFAQGRQELILKLCEAYFKALAASKRVQLVESAQRAIATELRFVREKGRAGQVPRSDVKEIEAQSQLALSELIDAQNRLRDCLEALSEFTGSPISGVSKLVRAIPMKAPHPLDPARWIEEAGTGNNELQAQQLAIDAQGFRRDEVVGDYLPSLEGQSTYDYVDQGGSQFGGGSVTQDVTVGVRLSVPVFNSTGRGYTFIKENGELQLEYQKLEQLRRRIAREIKDFLNSAVGASRKYEALTQAVEATRIRVDELIEKNRSGSVTSVDVLKAQRDLVRAERDRFDAIVEYVLAVTRLKARAGTLSELDIQYFDKFLG